MGSTHGSMEIAKEIPRNADKMLFAVDVICFFLSDKWPHLSNKFLKSNIVNIAETYRKVVHIGFSTAVMKTIKSISEKQRVIVHKDFLRIKDQYGLSKSSLMKYNTECRERYLTEEFQEISFLMFSARIVGVACYFFSDGADDALDVAVGLVESALPENMSILFWCQLHQSAEKFSMKSDFSKYLKSVKLSNLSDSDECSNSSGSDFGEDEIAAEKSCENTTNSMEKNTLSAFEDWIDGDLIWRFLSTLYLGPMSKTSVSDTPNDSVKLETTDVTELETACMDGKISNDNSEDYCSSSGMDENIGLKDSKYVNFCSNPECMDEDINIWLGGRNLTNKLSIFRNIDEESTNNTPRRVKRNSSSRDDGSDVEIDRMETEPPGKIFSAGRSKKFKRHETGTISDVFCNQEF